MYTFLQNLPKAEIHVHLEGTMGPELLLKIAERNKIKIPYTTLEQAKNAYLFKDYETFIQSYILNTMVLRVEEDFYDVMSSYIQELANQGVKHVEVFFDLQTYIPRKIQPSVIINGIYEALKDGERKFGITGFMIMCFIRHLPEEDAFKALEESLRYRDKIIGVGLASIEEENPCLKFKNVFKKAKNNNYRLTVHSASLDLLDIRQAIQILGVIELITVSEVARIYI
jgi:adenosine deaminase